MRNLKIKRVIFESYLRLIENSVGTKIFKNYYAIVNGKKIDAMRDGAFSCAFFVSTILKMFDLVEFIHWTVEGTVNDMEKNGWRKIKKLRLGSVIVWEKVYSKKDNAWHRHIGFFIGKNKAISNSPLHKTPQEHHYTFNNKRKIEAIYWNDKILKNV